MLHDIIYMWNLKQNQIDKNRVKWWLPGLEGEANGERLVKGYENFVLPAEPSWERGLRAFQLCAPPVNVPGLVLGRHEK